MHEEATSMSVPCSVAVSTAHNENGTISTISVVNAGDVELEVNTDNDLQVPFSTNSEGKCLKHVISRFAGYPCVLLLMHRLRARKPVCHVNYVRPTRFTIHFCF